MEYPNSLQSLEKDFWRAPVSDITTLARNLTKVAKKYDIKASYDLRTYPQYILNGELIERDRNNPIEYTHESVLGAPGADSLQKPLGDNEEWNKGRRATNTSAIYKIGADGRPINPYFENGTGITGQGLLWQYGPNHAIDNGILTIQNDEYGIPSLYTIGINRKDSADKASFSGGFIKFEKDADNQYVINHNAVINSRAEEFFEEMLSGSITLRPKYKNLIPQRFYDVVMQRMEHRDSQISKEKLQVIKEQVITELKMEQAEADDPKLLPRLKEVFNNAKECFAGPILNAGRNTNNSWIESRLSWIFLSAQKWDYIKGKNDFEFKAGDDAANVRLFKMDDELILNSDVSHTAMFAFMTASFLLDSQEKGRNLHPNIINQTKAMYRQLKKLSM